MKRRKDLTNKKFGRLTVLSIDENRSGKNDKHYRIFWVCQCDCGNRVTVLKTKLLKELTKSCGCFQKEKARETAKRIFRKLPFGEFFKRDVYKKYKDRAKKLGLKFLLTKEEFFQLIQKPCYYCSSIESNFRQNPSNEKDFLKYNGIDRINNDEGYTLNNVVPCCETCNKAKRNLPLDNFYKWVTMVHGHLLETKQICH